MQMFRVFNFKLTLYLLHNLLAAIQANFLRSSPNKKMLPPENSEGSIWEARSLKNIIDG